jgi:predicted alpha/beta hydrolase
VTGDGAVRVRTADDVELALFRARPEGTARDTALLLVHGTFSNRNFFSGTGERGLAGMLAARGYDAWVAELRGHGRSGPMARGRDWRFEDWIRYDAPALVRGVLEHSRAARLAWIGHSAGGIIGLAHAGLGLPTSGQVGGLVVASAPAPVGLTPAQRALAATGWLIARAVGRFPARFFRIGPEDEHVGVFGQWMQWNLRGEWHGSAGTDNLAPRARVPVPLLARAGGGQHRAAPPRACEQLLAACGGADRTFRVCGRATGFSENFDHNRVMVSRGARAEVWPLIADWLEQRFP